MLSGVGTRRAHPQGSHSPHRRGEKRKTESLKSWQPIRKLNGTPFQK